MPAIATDTYTVQPFATASVTGNAGDLLERIATALDDDERAIAPVVTYDYERQRIEALFQVDFDTSSETAWFQPAGGKLRAIHVDHDEIAQAATRIAVAAFDDALRAAGTPARTLGVSIVAGDDPDLLP